MTDLLDRLITRATRAVSPVEPILASRYEPRVANDSLATESNQRRTTVAAESSQQPAPRAIAAGPPPTERVLASPPPIRAMELGRVTVRADTVPSAIEIESPVPMSETTNLPLTPRQVDPIWTVEGHTQRVEGPSVDLAEMGSESTRAERVPVGPPSLRDRPSRTSTRAQSVESERADPVEVHVTIGHIEVRAAPSAKAPVPRTALPRLSLGDYLKRRNGRVR